MIKGNPVLVQAMKDWITRCAYLDNRGNYRIRTAGSSLGPIAPWNKEVKRAFQSVSDFRDAANENFAGMKA